MGVPRIRSLVAATSVVVAAFACGGKTTGAEGPADGGPLDETCEPGGTWSDGCNTCSCAEDGRTVSCTERACAEVDASVCAPGTRKIEDCNGCDCVEGQWACTLMYCGPTSMGAGKVYCGGLECDTRTSVCCDSASPPAAPDERCVAKAGTLPCGSDEARYCDEAADCADGEVCCQRASSAYPLAMGSVCAPKGTCGSGFAVQFCRTGAECGPGIPCIVQECRGRRIATCGGVPEDRCR